MARDYNLDLTPLTEIIKRSPEAAGRGGEKGLDEVKDDWVRDARNIAPLDTSNLRRQISGEVEKAALDSSLIVTANAKAKTGDKSFNYGYYIHEGHMAEAGRKLRTPGTVEQFLDDSADEAKFLETLEQAIKDQLQREGW